MHDLPMESQYHELRQKEPQHGYIPHHIVVHGEADALHAFSQALTYSDLRVGQVSTWDG